eukprot:TRINITY_DN9102_c0_g1_i2.p1 TRINITY_DN9102_c0_g1~~TRINITY_DN9102_c0_g1_i2.p1  ORF type:complete len:651 (+),score=91.20 TRINITY_DN9102_c0_g1_i2:111-2063(+)
MNPAAAMTDSEQSLEGIEVFSGPLACLSSRLPKQFPDVRLEDAFASKQRSRIQRNMRSCAKLSVLAVLAFYATHFTPLRSIVDTDLLQSPGLLAVWIYALSTLCIPAACWILSKSNSRYLEHMVLIFVNTIVPFLLFLSKRRIAWLLNIEFHVSWTGSDFQSTRYPNDSVPIAALSVVITAFFSALPVRCSLSWGFMFLLPSIYLLLSLFVADLEQIPVLGFFLWIQAALGYVGRGSAELAERIAFLTSAQDRTTMVKEKILRVQAEHQLELGRHAVKEETIPQEASIPDTSQIDSSILFETIENNVVETNREGVAAALDMIVHIGRDERWLVDTSYLEIVQDCVLGRGGQGIVALGRLHGANVAVKTCNSLKEGSSANSIINELRILRHIRHPSIVSFHGACVLPEESEFLLVEELVLGLPLFNDWLGVEHKIDMLRGICRALQYLHQQQPTIVHGDIKGGNILIDAKTLQPKLADFGLSRIFGARKKLGGTLRYAAPEVLLGNAEPDASSDIFSLGRLIYLVATGTRPLLDMDRETLLGMVSRGEEPTLLWPAADGCIKAQELYEKCTSYEPSHRLSIESVHKQVCSLSSMAPSLLQNNMISEPRPSNLLGSLAQLRDSMSDRSVSPSELSRHFILQFQKTLQGSLSL